MIAPAASARCGAVRGVRTATGWDRVPPRTACADVSLGGGHCDRRYDGDPLRPAISLACNTVCRMRRGALALAVLFCACTPAYATTTLDRRVVPGTPGASGFTPLVDGPGEPTVTDDDLAAPQAGREGRRRSLVYFAQLSDFQLADEEDPLRVEVLDQANSVFSAAWRPQEALMPFMVDASIRQVNANLRSPVRAGQGQAGQAGTDDPHRRQRRQPGRRGGRVGRPAARRRRARPQHRRGHRRVDAGPGLRRRRPRRARRGGAEVHGRPGLRRLRRVGHLLRPGPPHGAVGRLPRATRACWTAPSSRSPRPG